MNLERFLFGPYPIALQFADNVFFFSALAAIVIAFFLWGILFFRKIYPIQQLILSRFRSLFLTYGLVGLFWSWLRFENAPYLRWRFWFVVLILAVLVWLMKILVFVFQNYRSEMAAFRRQELNEKYLRSRKRK